VLLALALGQAPPARAEGLEMRSPQGDWQQAFALDTSVDMRIRGLLAEVRVRQRFSNTSGEWLEGRYRLPLPDQAAVGSLRMQVGERLIEGEVQEKQAAAATYSQAASDGRTASLVEHERANLFSTRVANIGPGETVEIEIGYWQAVRWQDDEYRIGLPLSFVPAYHGGRSEPGHCLDAAPAASLSAVPGAIDLGVAAAPGFRLSVDLDAGLPLAAVESLTHEIVVQPLGQARRVELAAGEVASDRDFELRWRPLPSAQPRQAVFVEQRGDAAYVLVNLIPPTLPITPIPRELILIVDNSGSMQGASMEQAKSAVDRALSQLARGDRFNVIRFDDSFDSVFPQPVDASAANVARARSFVQALAASGGTEMLAPLLEAFAMPATASHLRQVVLITDGAIGNAEQLLSHIEHGRGEARLFTIGIGSAPNAQVLRRAAELGRGAQVTIRRIEDVAAVTDALLRKLSAPALKDLKSSWPAGAEVFPAQAGDLYLGEPLQFLARLPQGAGDLKIEGRASGLPWKATSDLADRRLASTPGVARLWAQAQIEALQDQLRGDADPTQVRDAVLALALEHQLVSSYTSLVAVDRTPRRPESSELAALQFANADPAGSHDFAATADGFELKLRLAALLAGFALMLLVWRREGAPGERRGAPERG